MCTKYKCERQTHGLYEFCLTRLTFFLCCAFFLWKRRIGWFCILFATIGVLVRRSRTLTPLPSIIMVIRTNFCSSFAVFSQMFVFANGDSISKIETNKKKTIATFLIDIELRNDSVRNVCVFLPFQKRISLFSYARPSDALNLQLVYYSTAIAYIYILNYVRRMQTETRENGRHIIRPN